MPKTVKCLLIFCLVFLSNLSQRNSFASVNFDRIDKQNKFWQKNPDLKKTIFADRSILRSANHLEPGWSFKGVGAVSTPMDKTWEKALDFNALKDISIFLSDIRYDKDKKILSVKIDILGKTLPAKIKLDYDPKDKGAARIIKFEVIEGFLKGTFGKMWFLDSLSQGVQVEMVALYDKEVEFNDFLFQTAMETAMNQIALTVRTYIEEK